MTPWRPGDERADTRSMLRVDQAGEYGATRIYAGQLAVLLADFSGTFRDALLQHTIVGFERRVRFQLPRPHGDDQQSGKGDHRHESFQ